MNKIPLKPREECEDYMRQRGATPVFLTREEFDRYFEAGNINKVFVDRREIRTESRYHAPQAFGQLKNGRVVYCETNPQLEAMTLTHLNVKNCKEDV